MVLAGAVCLLTLLAFLGAMVSRRFSGHPPLPLTDLINLEFSAYEFGIVFQELFIPVAFVYLLSSTGVFRRVVGGNATQPDRFTFFGLLVVIQILSLNYTILTEELATFGVFVVVTGGLLGGWQMGLGLGLVTMLTIGTQDTILWPDDEILRAYQAGGLRGILDPALVGDIFLWRYVADLGSSSALWAGLVSSLYAALLGERRFAPPAALGLGVGVSLGVGSLAAISWKVITFLTPFLIPGALVSGLAMVALVLIVRSVQADVAELARTRAELVALRAQINPHFLFNALNTIRYFVRTDPEAARRLLLDLSEVFQRALRSGEFVSLQDELDYVASYLALEEARLDERLRVEWTIEVDDWLEHPVPTLILQPIVENAVIHGVAKNPEGGTVHITAERVGNDLVLRVEDDGPGIEPAKLVQVLIPGQESTTSIGLRNVDGRLRALYGETNGLVIDSETERGTRVEIKIPVEG
jgi:LytS/YehU family sensor histidine kinase